MNGFARGGFLAGWILLNCAIAFPAPARAADAKLGFIDSERIFAEYRETRDAQAAFNKDVETWNADAAKRKQEIERLQQELDSQGLMLSDAKKREKEETLLKRRSEYDAFVQEIFGPTGKIAVRNDQLTQPIIAKIKAVVNEIGTAEGYTMIVDSANGTVVFAIPGLDLTDRVLTELNKALGQPGTTPGSTD
jgi:outer membrane protein